MLEHFINSIHIIDFKCFKDFKVDGIERVNLISGKNNIGKTAFLEACYINVHAQDNLSLATAIRNIKFMRENINLIASGMEFSNKAYLEAISLYQTSTNIKDIKFELINDDGKKEYLFEIADTAKKMNVNEFSFVFKLIPNIQYIDNFGLSDEELITIYQAIQKQDQEETLNALIRNFDHSIDSFKVIGDNPQCKVNDVYYDLVEFGDGLKHYISIICALYASEDGQLFIDEIDNGIHYTQLQKIWKIIFDISKKVNCQVFTTTHSKECIEAFNEVNCDNDGAYFEFYRNQKTQEITVSKRDKEQLDYALSNNGRIRGE